MQAVLIRFDSKVMVKSSTTYKKLLYFAQVFDQWYHAVVISYDIIHKFHILWLNKWTFKYQFEHSYTLSSISLHIPSS